MRYATLKPPRSTRSEISVVVLAGEAGGELANVNRWRGQMGLAPLAPTALAPSRNLVKTSAGTVSVFDFTSNDKKTRMIAGLLFTRGSSWFLKLVGDTAEVGAARPEFFRWMETLRFEAENH